METLASIADNYATLVRRWSQQHAERDHGLLFALEGEVDEVVASLGDWTIDRYSSLQERAASAQLRTEAASSDLSDASTRSAELDRLIAAVASLEERRQNGPELRAALEQLDSEIHDLESQRAVLDKRVKEVAAHSAVAGPRQHELDLARKSLRRNENYLGDALRKASIRASQLGLEPERFEVEAEISALETEIARLEEEQITLDAAPAMRSLLETMIGRLNQGEDEGLADQVAIDDQEIGLELTVAQARAGMAVRRASLEGQPPPPQALENQRLLDAAKTRHQSVKGLLDLLGDVARRRRLVRENQQRVDAALSRITGASAAGLKALEDERRVLDERLMSCVSDRAAIASKVDEDADGETEEDLQRAIDAKLAELGLELPDLTSAQGAEEAALDAARLELAKAETAETEARRDLVRAESEIGRSWTTFARRKDLKWIRNSFPGATIDPENDPESQLVALDTVRSTVDSVHDRLSSVRNQLAGVERALAGVARHIRGESPDATQYVPELQTWLGIQFTEWFNNPLIRGELLPEATDDVSVELETREIAWREGNRKLSKPLEALSSGEQALAYTRVRLGLLDDDQVSAADRLIVLDEFGAFIAHDRLARLFEYLLDRASSHQDDQVLVILPLATDYPDLASRSVGKDAKVYARLAKDVEERRYAVRELLP